VSGEDFREDDRWRPLNVRNTRNLLIENVRISGGPANAPWLVVENSDNVTIRNITLVDANHEGPAVVVEDADHALIDNVVFTGQSRPDRAIEYRVRADERFGGLRIRNVVASGTKSAGIALSNLSKSGTLDSYAITDNMATVKADLEAKSRIVEGNL